MQCRLGPHSGNRGSGCHPFGPNTHGRPARSTRCPMRKPKTLLGQNRPMWPAHSSCRPRARRSVALTPAARRAASPAAIRATLTWSHVLRMSHPAQHSLRLAGREARRA